VDLALFEHTRHNPAFLTLQRGLAGRGQQLRDFCVPVNPYFPTPALFAVLRERLEQVLKYYPATNEAIGRALAAGLGLDPDTVVVGNGSTELLTWIDLLFVPDGLATPVPTFGRWTDHPAELGRALHPFPLRAADHFALDVGEFVRFTHSRRARAAAVCNPNNPTGALLSRGDALRLLDELAGLDVVVVDESFIDFADEGGVPSVADEAARRDNVVVLKSLGKNFGLHGLRAGYAVANPRLARRLRAALPHWNANGLAELLIREFPRHRDAYEESRRRVVRDRVFLEAALRQVPGLTAHPSRANFVYVRLPEDLDGEAVRNRLLTEFGLLVRSCGNKVGADHRDFRIAARPAGEVGLLIDAMREVLAPAG
jgi:histidinol-phosphate/aromatic aminotransferase/cobyric acid decarboxylase-like protein